MPLTNVNDLAELNPQTLVGFVRNLEYPGYELAEFFPDDFVQGNIAQFERLSSLKSLRSSTAHGTPKLQSVTVKPSSVALSSSHR